jgi:Ni/Fe-hydrogenase subunit HybB-like protein
VEQEAITRAETTGSFLLWYGVLGPPIVWAIQLLLVFGLDESVACTPGARFSGMLFNVSIDTAVQIVNAVATVLTLLAIFISYRCYRRLQASDDTVANRARWMAMAGLFNGSLFLLITVMKFAVPAFLSPCVHSL